jgi:hypothetical protein
VRTVLAGGALVLLVLAMLHARLAARERHLLVTPPPGSSYGLPDPELARFTTLGYHEAAADLAWLRTILYFGEQSAIRGRFEDFPRYVDLVIALDPEFRRIYHWAGVLMVYSRARITREMVESSIHYLKMGTERFPDDGEMHYMLGFNLYFEYPPLLDDPDARRRAKLEGIDHFKAALVSGTGPPWLATMVANLMTKQGLDELAVQSLRESLALVEHPPTRERIIARIEELERRTGQRGHARAWSRFQQDWAECCPYLPMDMYLLLEPRPVFPPRAAFTVVAGTEDEALDMLDSLEVGGAPDPGGVTAR